MIIDADYLISEKLSAEILNLNPKSQFSGFNSDIFHFVHKSIILEKIYPSKVIIFKKNLAFYKKIGHKEVLSIKGKTKKLKNFILHEDKKIFSRWITGQINIANDELKFIFSSSKNKKIKDRIRAVPILPIFLIIFYYIFKLNILKYKLGGLIFLIQRLIFETILNLKVIINYLKFKF